MTNIRSGITTDTKVTIEICDKHKIIWKEGDNYRENGGSACKECIEKAKAEA